MTLSYQLAQHDRTAVLLLSGQIDRDAVGPLDEAYAAAAAAGAAVVELDFTAVEYINSTGPAPMAGRLATARPPARPARPTALTAHYQHIFEITRLSDFIEVVQPV